MVNIFKKWIPEQMTFALPASIRNMIENHLVGPTASTVLALNGQARFSPRVLPHTGRTLIPAVASAANCAQMRVRRRRTEWPTREGCLRVGGVIGCEEQRVPTVEVCSKTYTGPRRSMPRCTPALLRCTQRVARCGCAAPSGSRQSMSTMRIIENKGTDVPK